jgi:pyridoxamine 5'-phosphate oxidase
MNNQDCIRFANENPLCSLATIDNNQPRVRLVGMWFADETGFYFQTGGVKEIPKQLRKTPALRVFAER